MADTKQRTVKVPGAPTASTGIRNSGTVSGSKVPLKDRIQVMSTMTSPPSTLICGNSGSGKTTLAATYPNPLFLDFDKRLRPIAHLGHSRIPFERSTPRDVHATYQDSLDALRTLKKGELGDFQTVVFDSLSNWSSFIEAELVRGSVTEGLTLPQYNLYKMRLESILTIMQDFPIQVVVTAHLDYMEHPGTKKQQAFPWVTGKKMPPRVAGWFDEVYLAEASDDGDYLLHVTPSGKFHECRSSMKDKSPIKNPTYATIAKRRGVNAEESSE